MILSGHKRNCNIKKNNCTVYCTIAKNYFCLEAKIAIAVHAVLQLVNPVQYRRRTHKLLYITEEELHTAQYRVKHNTVHFSTVRYNKDEKLYSVQYSKVWHKYSAVHCRRSSCNNFATYLLQDFWQKPIQHSRLMMLFTQTFVIPNNRLTMEQPIFTFHEIKLSANGYVSKFNFNRLFYWLYTYKGHGCSILNLKRDRITRKVGQLA